VNNLSLSGLEVLKQGVNNIPYTNKCRATKRALGTVQHLALHSEQYSCLPQTNRIEEASRKETITNTTDHIHGKNKIEMPCNQNNS
jgi:hypothetical protein